MQLWLLHRVLFRVYPQKLWFCCRLLSILPFKKGDTGASPFYQRLDYSSAMAFAAAMAFSWAGPGHSSYRAKCRVKVPRDWVMARRSMA